jgi:hypothetical protein
MSRITKFASLIDSAVRSRGRYYYRDGMVRIVEGDERHVRATVRGTSNYKVLLAIDGNTFSVSCTCPYYDEDVCKHIWATMLAAEERGYLYGSGEEPTRFRMANGERDDDDDDDFFDDDDDEEYDEEYGEVIYRPSMQGRPWQRQQQPSKAHWQQQIGVVSEAMKNSLSRKAEPWPSSRELIYIVDFALTMSGEGIVIELAHRERKKNGEWGKLRNQGVSLIQISKLPDPADREIVSLLTGAKNYYDPTSNYTTQTRFKLFHPLEETLLPLMCGTGRCLLRLSPDEATQLEWDAGDPWEFWLEIRRGEKGNHYVVAGSLRRDSERRELSEPALLTNGSLVFTHDSVARLNDFGAFAWVSLLRRQGELHVPVGQADKFMEDALGMPRLPRLDLPEELRYEEAATTPLPRLKVRQSKMVTGGRTCAASYPLITTGR